MARVRSGEARGSPVHHPWYIQGSVDAASRSGDVGATRNSPLPFLHPAFLHPAFTRPASTTEDPHHDTPVHPLRNEPCP
jgi:hypothetical protein